MLVLSSFRESERPEASRKENEEEDDGDDLDKLLEQYERQANVDKEKGLSALKQKDLSQMGMAELRETGLAKPLSADTKSVLRSHPEVEHC